jgi:hypothetical protein
MKCLVALEFIVDKNKLNKNYTSLLADVKQWMDVSENRVLQRNMAKIR